MLDQFPDDLNYVIKHFPLPNHQFARQGAMAALAAGQQGKFWEFHSRLLENHKQVNDEKIVEIAAGLQLDMEQFNRDRNSAAIQELIEADIENGENVGVRSTPSVFINGKRYKGGDLRELIRQELAK